MIAPSATTATASAPAPTVTKPSLLPTPLTSRVVAGPTKGSEHHLVYLSDSSGWNVANAYASLAEEALGGRVRVTDGASGGLSIEAATFQLGLAPEVVADADIVIGYGSPEGVSPGLSAVGNPCVYGDRSAPLPPGAEDWSPYESALTEFYQQVWRLRQGKPTVVIAFDLYVPVISEYRAAGTEQMCREYFEGFSGAIRRAATANGFTFVSVYDALNGPLHDQDPRALGYIGDDGVHTTDKGAQRIARALAAAGFTWVTTTV